MYASRRIVVLATLVALVSALAAGTASAERKNQWPFTRPVDSRTLGQAVRAGSTLDVAPVPEAKNELPFTNWVGVRATSSSNAGSTAGALGAGGGDSGGIDWALIGLGFVAAVTLAGGTVVALSSRRLSPRSQA
jgi:hypothetical protein